MANFHRVRQIAGILSVLTLLALIVLDVLYADMTLAQRHTDTLLLLIGSMLGLDIMLNRLPLRVTVNDKDGGKTPSLSSSGNDDDGEDGGNDR